MRINERVGSVRVRLASWSEMYGVSGEYADVLGEYKTDDILIVHTMGAIDMGNGAATGSLYVPNAVAEGAAALGGPCGRGEHAEFVRLMFAGACFVNKLVRSLTTLNMEMHSLGGA